MNLYRISCDGHQDGSPVKAQSLQKVSTENDNLFLTVRPSIHSCECRCIKPCKNVGFKNHIRLFLSPSVYLQMCQEVGEHSRPDIALSFNCLHFKKLMSILFSKALYGADQTIIGYKVALDTELAQGYPKREKAREWGFLSLCVLRICEKNSVE